MESTADTIRCAWANGNELLKNYHDTEWGVPIHDGRHLFELLNLEGAQAGLSWLTILTRRDNYRKAFDNFNPHKIARYSDEKQASLLQDAGIIRNRLKIAAVIDNAKAYISIEKAYKDFDAYMWSFVGSRKLTHEQSDEALTISKQMSKTLKKQGFRFVGPTTCYSFMQSAGMINDHEPTCFRHNQVQ